MREGPGHPRPRPKRNARLWVLLIANLVLVGALSGVGWAAHSLGVWAEGADYLADAAGIGVSLLALHLAGASSAKRPSRATYYAALVNAGWLLLVSLAVASSALARLASGAGRVQGLPVLVVSGVATIVMGSGAIVLAGSPDDDGLGRLNVQAVLLDTAADAAAAGGVAIAGGVIYAAQGLYWLDPAIALAVSVVVAYQAVRLLGRISASRASTEELAHCPGLMGPLETPRHNRAPDLSQLRPDLR